MKTRESRGQGFQKGCLALGVTKEKVCETPYIISRIEHAHVSLMSLAEQDERGLGTGK
jgi:hypothetical protein